MEIFPEIMLVDKPKGVSSFGALGLMRRHLSIPKNIKIGHAGTLDPMATGLLLVGVGKGTKKLGEYVGLDKTYEAEILLGVSTDTGDIEGQVTASGKPQFPKGKSGEEKIKEIVEGMVGKWVLPVPAYSAVKQGGEALYKKARRGAKMIIPNREMEILESRFLNLESKGSQFFVRAEFRVSSGTYIRSIAEEIGRRLSVPATLFALRRTKMGEFDIKDAEKVETK
jgi:tRNA pseudouridine55 synthase